MTKDEIVALETRFWQTMIDKDAETASALMAETCVITGAQGASSLDKATFAKMLTGGQWELHSFAFDNVQFVAAGPDVAVIGYTVAEQLTVDGKPLTMEAADASTWVRQGGSWLCVLHTESVLGDPFGRSR